MRYRKDITQTDANGSSKEGLDIKTGRIADYCRDKVTPLQG